MPFISINSLSLTSFRFTRLALLLGLGLALPASAASISLNASDAASTSSFNAAGHWTSAAAPAPGNVYFTTSYTLRAPTNTSAFTFAGDALIINTNGRFLLKTIGTTQIITVNNLILNGGNFEQATLNSDNVINTVAGNITVQAASGVGALGGAGNGSASFETLNLTSIISGSAPLVVSGGTLNGGTDTGVVRLSAANPYQGTLTVAGGVIASTVNRLLQLNNLNALSNATLALNTTVANPVSFFAGVNVGAFNVGGLAGTASQTLADTAGSPVVLNVGGNNSSSTFAGQLSGAGALVKTGTGTLTLAGANTYTGGTTVSNGTLQLGSLTGSFSGGGTVVLMAASALMPQTVVAGSSPFSGQWIVAGGWLVGGTNNALGTNSNITIDPAFLAGSLAGAARFEPRYDLNSAGSLTLTNGGQMVLHQNCAFSNVVIEGTILAGGTHAYAELAANFPANFPAGGAGYVTVQPYGALPEPPVQIQFLTQPVSQTTFPGMTARFSALAYGYPEPSYQWQCGAVGSDVYTNLADGGQFAGASTTSLTISGVTADNAASYVLVASNGSGSVTSSPALLTLIPGQPVLANATGLTLAMSANGTYTITSTDPAWTFVGSLGQVPFDLATVTGADAIGNYSELRFTYQASAPHAANIRLYTNQPVVLFTDTGLSASANDLAFPHLTSYPGGLYHLSYSGEFAPPTFSSLVDESPWVFFDGNLNTFILSPATNFVIASDVKNGDGSLACGINSSIAQLPAGFTHRTWLTIQPGINRALTTWGNALTGLTGKVRPANDCAVELNKLGYWTDNGATYYYNYSAARGYIGTMLAVRDEFAAKGLPLGYLQLDSWWYPKGTANTWQGDASNDRGGVNQYIPDPTLFPGGLAAFRQQLGLPLFTHCRWIDAVSPYRTQYAMSQNVIVDPAFWKSVMASLKAGGVTTFEQDWLSAMALPGMNLNDPPAFMDEMAAAAATNGLNLQYCMELPRHYLQSSLYNNLITLRVSIDRFERGKWNSFLYCSRLANAVGAWPWTDVYPSTEPRNVLLGVLSAGPVGVGDALGALNTNYLSKVVRPDGVIVKPDFAIAPLDQIYLSDAKGLGLPMVASTCVDHDNLRALYVFAYARSTASVNAGFTPGQLGITGPAYVYDYYNQAGSVLGSGSTYNFSTSTADNNAGGSFFSVVPIGPSGIAFLGDTNKFVSLGKKRIASLSDTGIVKATVVFAVGETNLTLSGYAPSAPYAWTFDGSVSTPVYDPVKHLFSLNVNPGTAQTTMLALSLSPPPFLQITNLHGKVQIYWPTSAIGYKLESAPILGVPTEWTATTNPVDVAGDQNVINVVPEEEARFYRLKQ